MKFNNFIKYYRNRCCFFAEKAGVGQLRILYQVSQKQVVYKNMQNQAVLDVTLAISGGCTFR